MANQTVTPEWVTMETAIRFSNSLRGVANFDRSYDDEFVQAGAKVGDTVKIRLPQMYEVSTGEGLVVQDILDRTVQLILNRRRHVGIGWSTAQETTDLDHIKSRYIQPAADTLASVYDRVALEDVYKSVYNMVGTLGTIPTTPLTYSTAVTKILDYAGPDNGLCAVLSPLSGATIAANSTATYFNPQGKIGENWTTGQMAQDQLGIAKWFLDQHTPRFTSGACPAASTPLVNGAGQTGSSMITDGWGATTAILTGDIVTFAGVYSVNPLSKASTGRLAQFVLTSDVSGATPTLTFSPSIVTSGPLQNVTNAPDDNAVVTYWSMAAGGTQAATVAPQNLVFAPKAFATVMVDLAQPNAGATGTRVRSKDLGVAMRYVQQYDITSDLNLNRIDILFGSAPVAPEWAVRVTG